jgi:hypothetical protein
MIILRMLPFDIGTNTVYRVSEHVLLPLTRVISFAH